VSRGKGRAGKGTQHYQKKNSENHKGKMLTTNRDMIQKETKHKGHDDMRNCQKSGGHRVRRWTCILAERRGMLNQGGYLIVTGYVSKMDENILRDEMMKARKRGNWSCGVGDSEKGLLSDKGGINKGGNLEKKRKVGHTNRKRKGAAV